MQLFIDLHLNQPFRFFMQILKQHHLSIMKPGFETAYH